MPLPSSNFRTTSRKGKYSLEGYGSRLVASPSGGMSWQFVSDCHHCRRKGRCGTVRGRQTSRSPYHHHSSKTNTIPTFSTKAGAGKCQEGPHARVTGSNVYQGGSALPVPGYPVFPKSKIAYKTRS